MIFLQVGALIGGVLVAKLIRLNWDMLVYLWEKKKEKKKLAKNK